MRGRVGRSPSVPAIQGRYGKEAWGPGKSPSILFPLTRQKRSHAVLRAGGGAVVGAFHLDGLLGAHDHRGLGPCRRPGTCCCRKPHGHLEELTWRTERRGGMLRPRTGPWRPGAAAGAGSRAGWEGVHVAQPPQDAWVLSGSPRLPPRPLQGRTGRAPTCKSAALSPP